MHNFCIQNNAMEAFFYKNITSNVGKGNLFIGNIIVLVRINITKPTHKTLKQVILPVPTYFTFMHKSFHLFRDNFIFLKIVCSCFTVIISSGFVLYSFSSFYYLLFIFHNKEVYIAILFNSYFLS